MEPEVKIEVITSESEHWYPSPTIESLFYPSVTTYLSVYPKGVGFNKYLVAQTSWESSQKILKDAGARGTKVHQATQLLEEGQELERDWYSLEEWEMLMGFVSWFHETRPKVIHIEKSLVCDELETGGTIDRIYDIDGVLTVLDIKTSGIIHDNYWVQAAVYARMAEIKLGLNIQQTAILRLTDRKKSRFEYKVHDREEWELGDLQLFEPLKTIWKAINPNKGPKILSIPTKLRLEWEKPLPKKKRRKQK